MADLSESKASIGAVFPENALGVSFSEAGPLITPDQLVQMHLLGIPLVSALKDPVTRVAQRITADDLKQYIIEAVSLAELETQLDFFSRDYEEARPYDKAAVDSWGYTVLDHRPAAYVQSLHVASTDGVTIWDVPLAWIDIGRLPQGQISIVPWAIAGISGTSIPIAGAPGNGLLPNMFSQRWVPSFWRVKYTSGFKNGKVPRVVNQLIGVIAAMEVLSLLASTYAKATGGSIGIDGVSQSISLPGAEIFTPRLKFLAEKRKWLVGKIKSLFNMRVIVDTV